MAKQDSNPGLRPVGIAPAQGDMADSGTGATSRALSCSYVPRQTRASANPCSAGAGVGGHESKSAGFQVLHCWLTAVKCQALPSISPSPQFHIRLA